MNEDPVTRLWAEEMRRLESLPEPTQALIDAGILVERPAAPLSRMEQVGLCPGCGECLLDCRCSA